MAHHAGPSRPESVRALEGLDRLAGFFAEVIRATGRQYEIVVVSDHGQSQGATFAQRSGMSLHDLVASFTRGDPAGGDTTASPGVAGDRAPAERWSSANLILSGVARSRVRAAGAIRAVIRLGTGKSGPEGQVTLGESASKGTSPSVANQAPVVAASGSLAHIYLPRLPGRAVREAIDELYPDLIVGLVSHPDIGSVIVRSSEADALVVLGAEGWRTLRSAGTLGGDGTDPLAVSGSAAADDVRSLDRRRHVGDIIVLGPFDPDTGEVAAFEELVGSHGGIGGGQTEALLRHPAQWSVPESLLHGLDVHRLLCDHLVSETSRR